MTEFTICENPDVLRVVYFIKIFINIIKIIIPILLIILVSFNCAKGVFSGEIKFGDSIKKDIIKIITAIIIFTIPTIITLVLNVLDENTGYESCWINAESDTIEKFQADWDAAEEEKRREELENNVEEKEELVQGNIDNINGTYKSKKVSDNLSKNYYKSFTYWLYLPDKVTKNLPIIVFLPGLGQRGNDYFNNSSVAITCGPMHEIVKHNYSYKAIIITMQVPSEQSVYGYFGDYIKLIDMIADEFSANKNKISIMGFSHGCYGIANMIPKYPQYFSAVVPIGCSIDTKQHPPSKFIYQPIWTFVGGSDGYGGTYSLANFVSKVNASGGNAKHTYAKSNAHNILTDGYSILRDEDYDVINWMISQTKDK